MTRRRRSRMPDPRPSLRAAARGAVLLALLGLAAWWCRPETMAERVDRIDAEVGRLERAARGGDRR